MHAVKTSTPPLNRTLARPLKVILALLMAVTFVPLSAIFSPPSKQAHAATSVWSGGIDISWYTANPAGPNFTLTSADQLAGFAAITNNKADASEAGAITGMPPNTVGTLGVNTGTNYLTVANWKAANPGVSVTGAADTDNFPADDFIVPGSAYSDTNTDFTQKTVNLGTNVDLGAIITTPASIVAGVFTAPVVDPASKIWTPIGAYSSSGAHAAGSGNGIYGAPFKGIFDGGLYEISNLYIPHDISGGSSHADDSAVANGHALFGDLGRDGVVKNVMLSSGYIKGGRFTAGIVGRSWGDIISCSNSATIHVFTQRGGGGIAGVVYKNGTAWTPSISNSINLGIVCGEVNSDKGIGGIAQDNEGAISNCINEGPVFQFVALTGAINFTGVGAISGDNRASSRGSIINCATVPGDAAAGFATNFSGNAAANTNASSNGSISDTAANIAASALFSGIFTFGANGKPSLVPQGAVYRTITTSASAGISITATDSAVTYGGSKTVVITPDSGVRYTVKVDGVDINLDGTGLAGTDTFSMAGKVGTYTFNSVSDNHTIAAVTPSAYSLVNGGFGTYSGSGDLTVTIDAPFVEFVQLTVEGVSLQQNVDYMAVSGSTIITLYESYLQKLAPGDYIYFAEFLNGVSEPISLTIAGNLPQTGADVAADMALPILLTVMLLGIGTLVVTRKKWMRK